MFLKTRAENRHLSVSVLLLLFLGSEMLGAEPPKFAAQGPLVIIGGALAPDNGPIYRTVLDATLPDRPLCLLATASSRPRRSLRSYRADFQRYGGSDTVLVLAIDRRHPERANKQRWARRLEACGGFFFTGGDQSRLVDIFRPEGEPTAVDEALRRSVSRGAVVAGTSAGAAMMSHPMIGDGTSVEALANGVVHEEGRAGVWLRDGMGVLSGALIDQHFLARGRFARLLVALGQSKATRYGFGIDEDTALVIDGDLARVVGRSSVIVLDRGLPAHDLEAIVPRLWLLANDDQLRLASGVAHGAEDKHLPATVPAPEVPADPWDGDAFHHLLVAFARSPAKQLELLADGLILQKEDGFRCLARGPAEKPRAVFAGPFGVALNPSSP